jgi:hypothetical protein
MVNDRVKLLAYWVLDRHKVEPKADAKSRPEPKSARVKTEAQSPASA